MVSRDNDRRADVILAFITSNAQAADNPDAMAIEPDSGDGLKVPSVVRFEKLATLEKSVIAGKIGRAAPSFLASARAVFMGVFGF